MTAIRSVTRLNQRALDVLTSARTHHDVLRIREHAVDGVTVIDFGVEEEGGLERWLGVKPPVALMRAALARLAARKKLSPNVREVVGRSLKVK